MPYSEPADVRAALVPGGGDTPPDPKSNTAADLDNTQLADAVAEADARIDSYLAARYVTPVVESSATIKALSRDIAAYFATLTNRKSKDLSDNDPVARRYAEAIGFLKDASAGRVTLSIPGNTGSSATGEAGAALNPYSGDLFLDRDLDLRRPTFEWPTLQQERW